MDDDGGYGTLSRPPIMFTGPFAAGSDIEKAQYPQGLGGMGGGGVVEPEIFDFGHIPAKFGAGRV